MTPAEQQAANLAAASRRLQPEAERARIKGGQGRTADAVERDGYGCMATFAAAILVLIVAGLDCCAPDALADIVAFSAAGLVVLTVAVGGAILLGGSR